MPPPCQPVLLIVLDGWGYSENTQYNAIHSAQKPVWDRLWAGCPHMLISASGLDVGLPEHQMGNSEVGHMHLGAGRTIDQEFTRITTAIREGEFHRNPVLTRAFDAAAAEERAVHLLGLLSPGGVHSHEDHVLALMEMAAGRGVSRIYVHAFLDGRDTPPKSAGLSLQKVMLKFNELRRCGRIASLIGRYYAMDRNHRWSRTQAAYDLVADGRGLYTANDPLIALDMAYARGETDEFVKATVIVPRGGQPVRVEDGDTVVFANFRADRARQLSEAFLERRFDGFTRARTPRPGAFVTMTRYSGEERVFPGEDRILVPSPHVPTYDQQPAMSAAEVTDRLVEAIRGKKYAAIICNFAHADMVGHTGNFEAAVRAIETLDLCLGRFETAAREAGMEMLITADHGNAEKMREVSTKHVIGQTHTAHTSNKVPLIYVGRPAAMAPGGTLADVAPTLLTIMGLPIPREMTGKPLLRLPAAAAAPADSAGRRAAS